MFIVDFDDTLLDTFTYKQRRMMALAALGVREEDYKTTYQAARNGYTHERHAALLAAKGYNEEKIVEVLDSYLARAIDYVFPDAVIFLEFLKKYGEAVVLLSLGIPRIQEKKIQNSGLHDYFDRVCVTDGGKRTALQELYNFSAGEKQWFFNDKVDETKEILEQFPALRTVLKQSAALEEKEYHESGLPFFKTLTEIKAYVIKHYN